MCMDKGIDIPPGFEVGYADVDHLKIRYVRTPGPGQPLLFCNGIGANLELALGFAQAMTDVSVILFDLPGLGQSPKAWVWPSFRRYAVIARGLMQALNVDQFNVAGVSWGGALAQRIAYDYPQQVSNLILMATSYGLMMVPGKPSALMRMLTPYRYLSPGYMERNAGILYGGVIDERPDILHKMTHTMHAPAVGAYLQQLSAISGFASLAWLRKIQCPALVMAGEGDPIVRPVNAFILSKALRNAEMQVIPNGGHLFLLTHANESAARVREFIQA